jgi:hypothetical protein
LELFNQNSTAGVASEIKSLRAFPKNRDWERCGKNATEQGNFSVSIGLTSEEIGFLKQLAAAGAVGRTMTGQV